MSAMIHSKHKNTLAMVFAVLLLIGIGMAIVFESPEKKYSRIADPSADDVVSHEPYRATFAGTYVCLPHKDMTGPQTEECAFGLRLENGDHYAVDFTLMSQIPPEISTGDQFRANGLVTPLERLSSDHWRTMYDIKGIFSVTDSVEVIGKKQ